MPPTAHRLLMRTIDARQRFSRGHAALKGTGDAADPVAGQGYEYFIGALQCVQVMLGRPETREREPGAGSKRQSAENQQSVFSP